VKDDRLYLIHIQEAIERIEEYTQDGKEFFLDDRKTQDAVLRNLHTLAESSQRISNALREQYPQVDWRILAAFRNVVVHDYLGISLDRVWDIVQNDLPRLKENVAVILRALE
jgi:uncharacterized protein with HEPN domain